jgi:YidC/Oxa1 family membrane protein insertase
VIIGALAAWAIIDRVIIKPRFPERPVPAEPTPVPGTNPSSTIASTAQVEPTNPEKPAIEPANTGVPPQAPEQALVLSNANVRVTLSNRGGTVRHAWFPAYRKTQEPTSGEIEFDFTRRPVLALSGLADLTQDFTFQVASSSSSNVVYRQTNRDGIRFERRLELDPSNYLLRVVETYVNTTKADLSVPAHDIQLGELHRLHAADEVYPTTGVDAYHTGGVGVKHYAQDIHKQLKNASGTNATFTVNGTYSWLSVKNRFFCQLLSVAEGEMGYPDGAMVSAVSDKPDGKTLLTHAVSANLKLPALKMVPDYVYKREYTLYLGPTRSANLKVLGGGQHLTIDFQLWRIFNFVIPICGLLLTMLNGIHAVVPNYGLAIILLTFFIRMAFWPLTHKGTQSMKKMQVLQPQIAAIKERYKDNPQKQQQAMMTLFKENKVNPAAGCLPILVQIPVFIGLYGTFRTAIELRFAHFLWIDDLSLSEGLLRGGIPLLGEINVLPLLMGVTMYFQQKLTPSTMDAMQQKIMNFMPIMLVVMCYKMPAGLLLYWTTSNLVSIVQLGFNKKWMVNHPVPVVTHNPPPPPARGGKKK